MKIVTYLGNHIDHYKSGLRNFKRPKILVGKSDDIKIILNSLFSSYRPERTIIFDFDKIYDMIISKNFPNYNNIESIDSILIDTMINMCTKDLVIPGGEYLDESQSANALHEHIMERFETYLIPIVIDLLIPLSGKSRKYKRSGYAMNQFIEDVIITIDPDKILSLYNSPILNHLSFKLRTNLIDIYVLGDYDIECCIEGGAK